MKARKLFVSVGLGLLVGVGGSVDVATGLEGVPNIPWCRVGESPKTHNCRDGSNSGGFRVEVELSKAAKPKPAPKPTTSPKPTTNPDDEIPDFGAPETNRGGGTRLKSASKPPKGCQPKTDKDGCADKGAPVSRGGGRRGS
jgi:hypothetical protein